ncbi:hypothetical protein [Thioclava marina]|nr:hypothetical protein [Thioclava marina]
MTFNPRHRFINLAQSVLLLAGMGAIGWVALNAIVGPDLALAIVLGSLGGLLLAPGMSKQILIRAYRARRLTGRDFPEGLAILGELARRAGLPRVPELYYIPSELPNAFAIGKPEDSVVCISDGL